MTATHGIAGKIITIGAKRFPAYKVHGEYYPASRLNCELLETYLHTGNPHYLGKLELALGRPQ